jgi:pantoate--beta-alanine ligase
VKYYFEKKNSKKCVYSRKKKSGGIILAIRRIGIVGTKNRFTQAFSFRFCGMCDNTFITPNLFFVCYPINATMLLSLVRSKRSIHIIRTIAEARKLRSEEKRTVGLVPTMGALHQGHLSLVQKAKQETETVWASIFVNPAQFAPHEDFSKYPRQVSKDVELLAKQGVEVVFAPEDPRELYPGSGLNETSTKVQRTFVVPLGVEEFDKAEGRARPGHFRGVATVVSKLFNILQPTKAFFGQKDGLQCIVIKQLVRDLNFPVEVVICDTVRESDGLAMSSRNVYLSAEQRKTAPVLYKALSQVRSSFEKGERSRIALESEIRNVFSSSPGASLFKIDYISFVDSDTGIEVPDTASLPQKIMCSAAINFGNCRILDNVMCKGS